MGKKSQKLTETETRVKISSYCAYQERSPKQVREKLSSLNLEPEMANRVFEWAEKENFVSENRFTETYISGKFNLKKWGRFKIITGLRNHGIPEETIRRYINEIDENDYTDTLISLGEKKINLVKGPELERWKKTMDFLIGKGFEAELILKFKKQITHV